MGSWFIVDRSSEETDSTVIFTGSVGEGGGATEGTGGSTGFGSDMTMGGFTAVNPGGSPADVSLWRGKPADVSLWRGKPADVSLWRGKGPGGSGGVDRSSCLPAGMAFIVFGSPRWVEAGSSDNDGVPVMDGWF